MQTWRRLYNDEMYNMPVTNTYYECIPIVYTYTRLYVVGGKIKFKLIAAMPVH